MSWQLYIACGRSLTRSSITLSPVEVAKSQIFELNKSKILCQIVKRAHITWLSFNLWRVDFFCKHLQLTRTPNSHTSLRKTRRLLRTHHSTRKKRHYILSKVKNFPRDKRKLSPLKIRISKVIEERKTLWNLIRRSPSFRRFEIEQLI